MENNFKNFINLCKKIENLGKIVLEDFSWTKNISKSLPNLQLDLPTVEREGTIQILMDKKNPIFIQLSDGSKLFFTYDEFKRIDGIPKVGKKMSYTMQRMQEDGTIAPSQIIKCKVI